MTPAQLAADRVLLERLAFLASGYGPGLIADAFLEMKRELTHAGHLPLRDPAIERTLAR